MTVPDFPMSDATLAAELITVRRFDGGPEHPDVVVLAPAGELDQVSAAAVWTPLEHELRPGSHVVLDLSAVEFFASVGVKILMAAVARANSTGAAFVIVVSNSQVRRPLELLGVLDQFPVCDSLAAALAACARQRVG